MRKISRIQLSVSLIHLNRLWVCYWFEEKHDRTLSNRGQQKDKKKLVQLFHQQFQTAEQAHLKRWAFWYPGKQIQELLSGSSHFGFHDDRANSVSSYFRENSCVFLLLRTYYFFMQGDRGFDGPKGPRGLPGISIKGEKVSSKYTRGLTKCQ